MSVEATRLEIERTLRRYGAGAFGYGTDGTRAAVMFEYAGRQIRFLLPLPDRHAEEFVFTTSGANQHSKGQRTKRTPAQAEKAYEQACAERWRALLLLIKAKLEGIAAGVVTFEEEFLAQTMLPGGVTVAEAAGPQIIEAYRTGRVGPILPGLPAPPERPMLTGPGGER